MASPHRMPLLVQCCDKHPAHQRHAAFAHVFVCIYSRSHATALSKLSKCNTMTSSRADTTNRPHQRSRVYTCMLVVPPWDEATQRSLSTKALPNRMGYQDKLVRSNFMFKDSFTLCQHAHLRAQRQLRTLAISTFMFHDSFTPWQPP